MANPQQQQVYQQWFTLADEDRDGAIAGAEAVKFFQRSGLDQMTLGQVWEVASGGAAKLNMIQFSAALRLVSLAQASGGRLPIDQARVVMAGMGPALPIPRMQGLEQYAGGASAGGAPVPPAGTPAAFANAGYVPQYTGATPGQAAPAAPTPAPVYTPQYTGAPGYNPQMTGGVQSGGASLPPGYAPATPADMQRYQAAFQQLDADRDGLVQGSDCFGYFLQWGLDKSVLRHIWEIVAGNSSALNQQQLTACLYMMDAAKRGARPPTTLPPGPFPPVAQQWSLQSQFGGASAASAAPAVSQQAVVLPTMPGLPVKFSDADQGEPAAGNRASQIPNFAPALMDNLAGDQRDKLISELKAATGREAQLFTVEDKAAQTKARVAAFNAAMQEVTVFKSRTDVAMLQAQDQAARLEEELQQTKARYEKSYAAAQSQGDKARKLREHLGTLMAEKTEADGKLLQLEAEIAAASAVTPADVARMEQEVHALHQRIATQETVRDSKSSQLAAIRQQRQALESRLAEVEAARTSVDQEIREAQKQVNDMQNAITAARAKGDGAVSLAPLLSKAAEQYRTIYGTLLKSGTSVPFECLPSNLTLAVWMDDAMAGVTDWNDLDDQARGFVLVNAMPGQRIETNKGKASTGATADTAEPLPADAFGEAPAFDNNAPAAPAAPASSEQPAAPADAAASQPAAPAAAAPTPVPAPAAPEVVMTDAGFGDEPAFGSVSQDGTAPAAPAPPAAAAAPAPAPAASGFGFDDNAFT